MKDEKKVDNGVNKKKNEVKKSVNKSTNKTSSKTKINNKPINKKTTKSKVNKTQNKSINEKSKTTKKTTSNIKENKKIVNENNKFIKEFKEEPIDIKLLTNDTISKKTVIIICLVLLLTFILVMFLPKIYTLVEKIKAPEVSNIEKKEEKEEEVKITDELLEELAYPVMRYSKYDSNSYYMKDEFSIKDMSNKDILYTAFLDVYEGNITNSDIVATCTDSPKQLKAKYIELRIKNILSKNLEYKFENFTVPLGSTSNYIGEWKYEGTYFTYQGNCNLNVGSIEYYDLKEYKEAYFDKDNLIVYYYIGFAKVENGTYVIYSDPNYTKEVSSGEFISEEELNKEFKNLKRNKKQLYKYEFNTTKCSYDNYCLTKGMWVNGQ